MEPLTTLLQPLRPLTSSLPPPLRSLLTSLLGPACYATLIVQLAPTPGCVSLLVSKLLGSAILLGAPLVKVDQIRLLVRGKSGAGVSLPAYVLETGALGVGCVYNARRGSPVSTYGEAGVIAVQNLVVLGLVCWYRGVGAWGVLSGVVGALAVGWGVLRVGEEGLGWAQMGAGVVGVLAKGPQIWEVWREGGTGELSALAVFMYLAGSLARIFTTMREVGDSLILFGFVAGFLLNAVLAAQMLYYWKSSGTKSKSVGDEKRREKVAVGSGMGTASKPKGPTTRRRG